MILLMLVLLDAIVALGALAWASHHQHDPDRDDAEPRFDEALNVWPHSVT